MRTDSPSQGVGPRAMARGAGFIRRTNDYVPENATRQSVMLRSASVISILFFIIHVVDDIIRGYEKGGVSNLAAIPTFVLWLYGTLVLGERRSGYVIMLLGGLFGLLPAIAHMRGKGLGVVSIVTSSGGFFFVFATIALGVTALFSFLLAAQGLWRLRPGGSGLSER